MAREDVPGERRLVAYVVSSQEPAPAPGELRRFLQERLPEQMLPSATVLLDALPSTPSGKVDRRSLPAPDWSRPDAAQTHVPPRTAVEEALAGIWAQVLGVDRVGIHDSFFDLGGHSLLATQLISRVRDTLRVEVPLRAIFDSPTVAGMAAFIAKQKTKVVADEQLDQMVAELEQMPDEEIERLTFEENNEMEESQR